MASAGRVELPSWPAGRMCILEYLPLVKDAVQASIAQAVRVCTIRRDVFRELSNTGLGAPIELDTISYRYTLALLVSHSVSVQAPCMRYPVIQGCLARPWACLPVS